MNRIIGYLCWAPAALALICAAEAATVTVSPATVTLGPLGQRQFSATVGGGDQAVIWLVNGVVGGAPGLGFVSASGLYQAPSDIRVAASVSVQAESKASPLSHGGAIAKLSPGTIASPIYDVATTGSDTAAGNGAHPWRTIEHAVNAVPAGATIEVKGGVYNELVTITRSGSATAGFTTLAAAPGESPIIDGTGLPIPGGENGLVTIQDASFVRLIGFELRNYTSNSAALDPVGILVDGAGSHIELLDNHVHDIITHVKSSAGDALGIAIYGTRAPASLQDVVIDGNELDDLITGFSESLAISGNVGHWQVTNNRIHDNDNIGVDIGGFEGFAPQTAYDRARFGYVAGNTVYNISSLHNPAYQGAEGADGIYVDGGTNVVIERNLVHNADFGIEVASEHTGRTSNAVTVRSNVVYQSNLAGITIGGYDASVGGTTDAIIVNNTLSLDDTTGSGSGEIQVQYHASANAFRNNVAAASDQGLLVNAFVKSSPVPAAFARDLYASPVGASNSQFVWQGRTYNSFAAYLAGAATDGGSRFASPMFVDAAAHDYQLAKGSPAIDAGIELPLSWVGSVDFAGKPRVTGAGINQGAFQ